MTRICFFFFLHFPSAPNSTLMWIWSSRVNWNVADGFVDHDEISSVEYENGTCCLAMWTPCLFLDSKAKEMKQKTAYHNKSARKRCIQRASSNKQKKWHFSYFVCLFVAGKIYLLVKPLTVYMVSTFEGKNHLKLI